MLGEIAGSSKSCETRSDNLLMNENYRAIEIRVEEEEKKHRWQARGVCYCSTLVGAKTQCE